MCLIALRGAPTVRLSRARVAGLILQLRGVLPGRPGLVTVTILGDPLELWAAAVLILGKSAEGQCHGRCQHGTHQALNNSAHSYPPWQGVLKNKSGLAENRSRGHTMEIPSVAAIPPRSEHLCCWSQSLRNFGTVIVFDRGFLPKTAVT